MKSSLSLFAAVLVSLQCTLEASALVNNRKGLDNNLQPNVVPKPQRRLEKLVHIQVAPPETVRHQPGTRLVLECLVLGRPAPSVQWLKNGEPVEEDYEEKTNDILPTHPSSAGWLVSKIVITSSTSGDVYTCLATSGVNEESASTTVYTVDGNDEENLMTLQKLFHLPSKPIITSYYTDVFQNLGTEIVLPCRVNSADKAQVFWQDPRKNLIYGDSRRRVLPSGDLLVTRLEWSDMGNFTCIADNVAGKDVANTFVYTLQHSK